ncbi:MAG: hypothetical protein R2795_17520 [Saprospiraceae bacterium]
MNTRKIKLALTAGLINKSSQRNALVAVKELMNSLADEAGRFLVLQPVSNQSISNHSIKETYSLRYERCTLDVELISYPQANRQAVQGFRIHT